MGDSFLDLGKMLTGRFGRRYMVKQQLSHGDKVQVYDLTESGKSYIGVAILSDSSRLRTDFLEPESEMSVYSDFYSWPKDVFTFERHNKKYCGYIAAKSMKNYAPLEITKKTTMQERYKISYGIAKAFSQLHIQGYVFSDVPQIWCDKELHVQLIGVPLKEGTKLSSSDFMGELGISAPELYSRGVLKVASIYTDRFLMASMIFRVCIGIDPFVKLSNDPADAYKRFSFCKDVVDPIEDYGFENVSRFSGLNEKIKAYFVMTFMLSVNDPMKRIEESDWAYALETLF